MAGDNYMTNPDAQQGESTVRKSSRNPANISGKVQPEVDIEDSVDEGPVSVPDHPGKPGDRTIQGGKTPTS
jgi:hypothetical protein